MNIRLALLVFLFSSCATAPVISISRDALIGEWRYADSAKSCHYVFQQDGTFRGEVLLDSKLFSKFTGRWSLREHELLYQYTSDALGRIAPGSTDRDTVLSVGKEFFVIEAADGSKRKYIRIK